MNGTQETVVEGEIWNIQSINDPDRVDVRTENGLRFLGSRPSRRPDRTYA